MNRYGRSALFSAVILFSGLAVAPAGASTPHVEPIAIARHGELGSVVSVIGSVTVPSGAFDGGFAIQGLVEGIYVLDAGGEPRAAGDIIQVTGALVDNYGLLSIQPTSVTLLFRAPPLRAHPFRTGAVGEKTEGRLLHLRGTMVGPLVDDSPYGFKLDMDDGSGKVQIFLYPGTGISTTGLVAGARVNTSCFSNQFETTYECDPPSVASFRVE